MTPVIWEFPACDGKYMLEYKDIKGNIHEYLSPWPQPLTLSIGINPATLDSTAIMHALYGDWQEVLIQSAYEGKEPALTATEISQRMAEHSKRYSSWMK